MKQFVELISRQLVAKTIGNVPMVGVFSRSNFAMAKTTVATTRMNKFAVTMLVDQFEHQPAVPMKWSSPTNVDPTNSNASMMDIALTKYDLSLASFSSFHFFVFLFSKF